MYPSEKGRKGEVEEQKKSFHLITLQPPKENTYWQYKCFSKGLYTSLYKPLCETLITLNGIVAL